MGVRAVAQDLVQSMAILRYAGRVLGMYGSGAWPPWHPKIVGDDRVHLGTQSTLIQA